MKKAFKIKLWNQWRSKHETNIVVADNANLALAGAIEHAAIGLKRESVMKKRSMKWIRGYFTLEALDFLGGAIVV
jgi:hypothetical protein